MKLYALLGPLALDSSSLHRPVSLGMLKKWSERGFRDGSNLPPIH